MQCLDFAILITFKLNTKQCAIMISVSPSTHDEDQAIYSTYFACSKSFFGQLRPPGLNTTHVKVTCNNTREQLHIIHYNEHSLLLPKCDGLQAVCEATRLDFI